MSLAEYGRFLKKRLNVWRYMMLLLVFGDIGCSTRDQPNGATVIPSAEARMHKNENCTVELIVRVSKQEPDRPIHYLDSEVDWQNPNNFAVKIADNALNRFENAGIANPAVYFKGKKIRVTGRVVFDEDQFEIVVAEPSQIKIID